MSEENRKDFCSKKLCVCGRCDLIDEIEGLEARLAAAEAKSAELAGRIAELESAIKKVLADEESGKGWGPDVTTVKYLESALSTEPKGGK